MKTLEIQREKAIKLKPASVSAKYFLGADEKPLLEYCDQFQNQNIVERLFQEDANLWKQEEVHQKSIKNRLGWLKVHEWILGKL